ncbi:hypothetical protein PNA2_1311 [Pyrococcus sp. NA2]|uniref:hypothetical protein n=1 Tax=Pyrococcus sp. (strain NA2) TaxID=342949 RepID=UPI000209AD6F|nr:hypothetical protein [Pyrococcus sp. NA2]AEC52226.1 hypothetical protein PNA2_1311 [Pyrococcus sp. NA2]
MSIIETIQNTAQNHPYLALAMLLLLFGMIISNKLISYVLYFLAFLAILKEFGLIDVLISFLKALPSILSKLSSVFGGVGQ